MEVNYSKISLNKNSNISKYFEYRRDENFTNFFKGFCNIFISIHNQRNERKQIEKNIDYYLGEINNLIKNYINTYEEEIQSRKDELL